MTTKTNYKVDGYSITEEVRVITPAEASEKSCINSLRNRLIADLVATTRMTGSFRQSLIAKVWNYYIKGKDVKVLAYNPTTEGTIDFI